MATLHSDKEIAQAFRTLGHTDRRIGTGRIAAWAGWATIALFTVAFFSSVVFLLSSEQRAESVRLKQSADLVAQAMESRLLGTTELLMKTSLRLMHIPNVRSQVASAELSATNFMQDRREVAEIVIATRDFTVLRSWNNPMSDDPQKSQYAKGDHGGARARFLGAFDPLRARSHEPALRGPRGADGAP